MIVSGVEQVIPRPCEVTLWRRLITYSPEHEKTLMCAIVFLLSYLSLCPSYVSIVACDWELAHSNDRNLVLLNRAASLDTDAGTFLELVVCPAGNTAPLSMLVCPVSSAPLKVTVGAGAEWQKEVDTAPFRSPCCSVPLYILRLLKGNLSV